jgi:hypothetical protein
MTEMVVLTGVLTVVVELVFFGMKNHSLLGIADTIK